MITVLKSKIHRATVTDCNLNYEGSITIDHRLMQVAGILPYEQVHVLDIDNGVRLITYAQPYTPIWEGSWGRQIIINGAAAKLIKRGHLVIILSYQMIEPSQLFKPTIIRVDSENYQIV